MPRPATVSPDRILVAAALEFAERGYAGARVDRIARHARVNKAMLYYHFGSKQSLYRALLRQIFTRVAKRLEAIAAAGGPSDQKIRRVVATMAEFIAEHAAFPAIMLREVADGGVHLDRDTLKALAAVPLAVGDVVRQGVADKTLRRVHPVAAYFTMFAPIIMYSAGAPIRKQLTSRHLVDMNELPPDVFVHDLQESMNLALSMPAARHTVRRSRSPKRRSSPVAPGPSQQAPGAVHVARRPSHLARKRS